jgi:hypothetical protein
MNKKLKKYNDFLNESLVAKPKLTKQSLDFIISRVILKVPGTSKETIQELRDDFEESVIAMSDFYPGWFSDMCKRKDANPEADYQEMQNLLNKKGWDFESIKNLFSEEANKLVDKDFDGWFNSYGQIGSQNGHCDVYLYFTAKKLGLNANDIISLGGDGWANYNEGDEMYIRYRYGYHQTKYGQLMLDQIGYTVEQFREEALVYLQQDIKDNWGEMISSSVMRNGVINKVPVRRSDLSHDTIKNLTSFLRSSIQIEDYTLVEDDRMIIYTNEMAEAINKSFPDTTTSEDVSSGIVKYLEWAGTDIEVIDGDVVIWGKFKVDS